MSQAEEEQVTPSCRELAELGRGHRAARHQGLGCEGLLSHWSSLQKPLQVALPVLKPTPGKDALGQRPALP